MARREARAAPFWHRSRLGWVNGLGFALTCFYAAWLVLTTFRSVMPNAKPLELAFPGVYMAVVMLALVATVVLCGIVIFGFAWRGADFSHPTPRMYVFLWSASGLILFLVLAVVLGKFGNEPLPNVARWASTMFWHGAYVGLPTFGLMTWVNTAHYGAPAQQDELAYDDYDAG